MSEHPHHSEEVVKRCEALIEHLTEFPKTFDMGRFMYGTEIDGEHPCGTIGCLAGTLVFLEEGPLSGKVTHDDWDPEASIHKRQSIALRARNLLEIDAETSWGLWYVSGWPKHLVRGIPRDENGDLLPTEVTAEDGIKRIRYFLDEGI